MIRNCGMRRAIKRLIAITTAVLAVVTVWTEVSATSSEGTRTKLQKPSESIALREKARYYFTQGALEAAMEHPERAYEYYKRAFEIDSTYKDASYAYGNLRLFVRTDTLQSETELKRSMRLLQDYVDENPKDLYAAQMYGYVATVLDTVEESVRVYERAYDMMPKETLLLPVLADSYMRLFKTGKAIEALEKYEKIEGKSKDLSLKKITILLASQDTIGAIGEVDALVEYNPKDPYSRLLKGNLYELVGEMDSVLKAYKEAEVLAPDNGAVKMSLAQYYRTIGDSVMLDNKIYEALLSEEFELDEKLAILGEYLQKLIDDKGDKSRGDHLFSVLQSQYPYEPEVLDMSARYSAAKGDYPAAIEALEYAIDMDPTNERYWLMLMSFRLAQEEYRAAVDTYQRAKEFIQPSVRLKNMYGAAASMLDSREEAEHILESLLVETDERLNPATATIVDRDAVRSGLDYEGLEWVSGVYCMLGDLYYKHGEAEKGFQNYEYSIYFLADNPLALNNFAYFLSEKGKDLEKAKKMSRRSLDLSDNNPTYLDTYAWILYKLGDYREALEYIELAIELAGEPEDENDEFQKHYEAIKQALENEDDN